jgi:hypothetical protein
MVKKILLPFERGIDNSNSFSHAVSIAQKMQADLVVLHTFTFRVGDDITEVIYQNK